MEDIIKTVDKNVMLEEIETRMKKLKLSKGCINALIAHDTIWESEGHGALYEINDKEKKIVKDFEARTNCKVYHIIHSFATFGELYNLLYVSPDTEEWENDKLDIDNGYVFVYVENISDPICSEFGTIAVVPQFGGLVRIG